MSINKDASNGNAFEQSIATGTEYLSRVANEFTDKEKDEWAQFLDRIFNKSSLDDSDVVDYRAKINDVQNHLVQRLRAAAETLSAEIPNVASESGVALKKYSSEMDATLTKVNELYHKVESTKRNLSEAEKALESAMEKSKANYASVLEIENELKKEMRDIKTRVLPRLERT